MFSGTALLSGVRADGQDELVEPLLGDSAGGEVFDIEATALRMDSQDAMPDPHFGLARPLEGLRRQHHERLGRGDLVGDVVRHLTGAVGDVWTLLEQDDVGVGIDAFGLGGSGRAGSDTSYHSDALTHAGSILDFGFM